MNLQVDVVTVLRCSCLQVTVGLGVRNSDFPAFTPTPCKLYPGLCISLYQNHQLSFYKRRKEKSGMEALAYNLSILGNKGRNITGSLRPAWSKRVFGATLEYIAKPCLHRKGGKMEG